MTAPILHQPDPRLDLLLERVIDVPPEVVWNAWTQPEQVKKWFTPAPWKTVDCEIDLRPGGRFRTVMQSPEGQQFPNEGCFLEIVQNRKLVWTGALLSGYRPLNKAQVAEAPFLFSAVIRMEPEGSGTRYSALVIHSDEEDAKKHEAMGFHVGWGAALDQLVAMAKQ